MRSQVYYASVTDGNTPVADAFYRKNPRYPCDDLYLIQWPNIPRKVYGVYILYSGTTFRTTISLSSRDFFSTTVRVKAHSVRFL